MFYNNQVYKLQLTNVKGMKTKIMTSIPFQNSMKNCYKCEIRYNLYLYFGFELEFSSMFKFVSNLLVRNDYFKCQLVTESGNIYLPYKFKHSKYILKYTILHS